ncbi:hypothetical protein RUMGNA_02925 [Mediterraneibacter gnavus ATCC 29149]|uniref:Uncharacterized protein n=1 Tax=Mediterraneibacter gnavus (strain ATCC 29149 / DSM 114966 / JCM 6515 / VPI C7-9) TaxID=411470 RepID=A7B5S9_MEDG7|nr:hypothetical protein RUMGNA_02925 [Mediterraneibacter gnavus ATCC 29149]
MVRRTEITYEARQMYNPSVCLPCKKTDNKMKKAKYK